MEIINEYEKEYQKIREENKEEVNHAKMERLKALKDSAKRSAIWGYKHTFQSEMKQIDELEKELKELGLI